jgi:hypothetical protein
MLLYGIERTMRYEEEVAKTFVCYRVYRTREEAELAAREVAEGYHEGICTTEVVELESEEGAS